MEHFNVSHTQFEYLHAVHNIKHPLNTDFPYWSPHRNLHEGIGPSNYVEFEVLSYLFVYFANY